VAIASGLEEAVDGWVSANYILGTTTAGNAQESMGTMDLGGASIQVPEALSAVLMPRALCLCLCLCLSSCLQSCLPLFCPCVWEGGSMKRAMPSIKHLIP